jgi:hypothetical protein
MEFNRLKMKALAVFGPIADSGAYPDGSGQPIYRASNPMNHQTN